MIGRPLVLKLLRGGMRHKSTSFGSSHATTSRNVLPQPHILFSWSITARLCMDIRYNVRASDPLGNCNPPAHVAIAVASRLRRNYCRYEMQGES